MNVICRKIKNIVSYISKRKAYYLPGVVIFFILFLAKINALQTAGIDHRWIF